MESARPHKTIRPQGSIAILDPLRALAAASVIAWHLSDRLPFVMPLFSSAAFAVDVFMNISGFLMAYHFFARESREPWNLRTTWTSFYLRRFFRISPLFYLLLLIVFFWQFSGDWQWLVYRFTYLFGFIPSESVRCPMPDWSIALEMQFYLVFPFLAMLMRRIGEGAFFALCSTVGAISFLFFSYYTQSPDGLLGNFPQPAFLPLKIHIFSIGMIVASLLFNGVKVLRSWWYVPGFVFFAGTCHFNYTKLMFVGYLAIYAMLLFPIGIKYTKGVVGSLNSLIENRRWLRLPAELSYSAYLVHNLVFAVALIPVMNFTGLSGESLPSYLALFCLMVGVIALIGWALFVMVERPGINLGRKIVKRISKANNPGVSADSR